MAGIFADEGISGTRTKNRAEFLKLIELCKKGKVDLILIKSLSRFARNTVDSLNYIRALKAMGVGIIFEKENLNTLEMDNEVMLTIHSCFAQAESESISANVRWGRQQSFKSGKVSFQYSRILGYEKGDDEKPRIVPEQAEIVRRIFYRYLEGQSVEQIKTDLEAEGIPTATGRPEWSRECIKNILKNEKYIGDALLQKTYVADLLTKKVKKNNGERAQYYVSNHHEPIIERDVFHKVQEEMARRQSKRKVAQKSAKTEQGKYSGKYALSERLYCGDCGTRYRRCTWVRNGEKKIVWRCINRLEYGPKYCKQSPTIDEHKLHKAIMRALNKAAADHNRRGHHLQNSISIACNGRKDGFDPLDTQRRIDELSTGIMAWVQKMADGESDVYDIEAKIAATSTEIEELRSRLRLHETERTCPQIDTGQMSEILVELHSEELNLDEYDDSLIRRMVEGIKVVSAEKIVVRFGWRDDIEEMLC